jgi:hypothetical protein
MANQTFSQTIQNFKVMAGGITSRLTSLTSINIVADDAETLTNYATELEALNVAQEDLKAKLKAKTEEMDKKMAEAKAKHAELSKRIKIVTPKEDWLAFGINAKR